MSKISAILVTGRKVVVKELTGKDEELALMSIGTSDVKTGTAAKRLINELIKMMIVEIDGEQLNYQSLQEKDLNDLFSIKEQRQMEALYQKLHVPSEKEDESFFQSIRTV